MSFARECFKGKRGMGKGLIRVVPCNWHVTSGFWASSELNDGNSPIPGFAVLPPRRFVEATECFQGVWSILLGFKKWDLHFNTVLYLLLSLLRFVKIGMFFLQAGYLFYRFTHPMKWKLRVLCLLGCFDVHFGAGLINLPVTLIPVS